MDRLENIRTKYKERCFSFVNEYGFYIPERLRVLLIIVGVILLWLGLPQRFPDTGISFWIGLILLFTVYLNFRPRVAYSNGFEYGFESGWEGGWEQQITEQLRALRDDPKYLSDLADLKKNLASKIDDVCDIEET